MYTAVGLLTTIHQLSRQNKYKECIILGRAAYETILNICFIYSVGEEALTKSRKYSLQKIYREANKELEINGVKIKVSTIPELRMSEHPELFEALNEYTTKSGKEKKQWTPETIEQKISIVLGKNKDSKVAYGLLAPYFGFYAEASEIIHGSLYGTLSAMGHACLNPPRDFDENNLKKQDDLVYFLYFLELSINALALILSKEGPLLKQIVSECRIQFQRVSIIIGSSETNL